MGQMEVLAQKEYCSLMWRVWGDRKHGVFRGSAQAALPADEFRLDCPPHFEFVRPPSESVRE